MKKFLLGTVALVALGATVPALAADLGARRPTPRLRPMPRRSTTGPASTSAVTSAALSTATTASTASSPTTTTAASSAVCRPAPTISSLRTGCSVSKVSTAGSATTTTALPSAGAGYVYTNNQRAPRLGDRPRRLHLGSGSAVRQGRLCLLRLQRVPDARRCPFAFALNSSHHDGYTVGAGLEYMFAQNWSAKVEYQYYDFGKTNFVTPGRCWCRSAAPATTSTP